MVYILVQTEVQTQKENEAQTDKQTDRQLLCLTRAGTRPVHIRVIQVVAGSTHGALSVGGTRATQTGVVTI